MRVEGGGGGARANGSSRAFFKGHCRTNCIKQLIFSPCCCNIFIAKSWPSVPFILNPFLLKKFVKNDEYVVHLFHTLEN